MAANNSAKSSWVTHGDCEKKHASTWRYISAVVVLTVALIVVSIWAMGLAMRASAAASAVQHDLDVHNAQQEEVIKNISAGIARIEKAIELNTKELRAIQQGSK